ncbi:hypothetical protein GMMP1_140087 [Candidatus Magnetomoraceae bacterium gMMP-1]
MEEKITDLSELQRQIGQWFPKFELVMNPNLGLLKPMGKIIRKDEFEPYILEEFKKIWTDSEI